MVPHACPERSEDTHEQPTDHRPPGLRRHRGRPEGDPQGRHADHQGRRDPRDHGPQRLRQVDPGVLDRRAPEVHRHRWLGHPRRRGRPDGEAPKLRTWVKDVNAALEQLNLDSTFSQRSVNEGFSGGEKKRHEIAQLDLLDPKVAILDETDSGLDIDALKIVSEGVNRFRERDAKGVLLITHYTRILRYITPDFVHVFVDGKVAESGGPELAEALEAEGYDKYLSAAR